MEYNLTSHERGYNISFYDGLFSIVTGLSGGPYAKRHWELSNVSKSPQYKLGHRCIAVLQYIPVVGALAAVIEKICDWAFNKFFNNPYKSTTSSKSLSSNEYLNVPSTTSQLYTDPCQRGNQVIKSLRKTREERKRKAAEREAYYKSLEQKDRLERERQAAAATRNKRKQQEQHLCDAKNSVQDLFGIPRKKTFKEKTVEQANRLMGRKPPTFFEQSTKATNSLLTVVDDFLSTSS